MSGKTLLAGGAITILAWRMIRFFALMMFVANATAQEPTWSRAGPGPEAAAMAPYDSWPADQAGRMRNLHIRFCGNLRLALPDAAFPFADDQACLRRQEALLAAFCDASGRSLRRPAAACFAAVNTEMRAGLNRLSGPTARWATDPLPPPRAPARLEAPLDPAQIFELAQASIWLVHVDSGLPGRGGA
ncbi:MAG: hypothetical protein H7345_02455 [Rubritepida sp.]|nr:hypothetical protein [Rubritepida sp.]